MTTPDKEVNPTTDRAAGPWTTDGRYIRASERGIVSDVIAIVDGRARMTNEANAQFIVTACNAYEPMREALDELANAARTYVNVTEREVIPEGDLLSTTAWHGLIECLHNAEKAHTALSTLPVNDRQTSDDVGILRKATAAIEDDDLRNDLADICTQALADAPEVLADPRGLDVLLDAIVCLFRDKARAALKGVPQPASDKTPEMKRAAMTDARNVCELADTLREIEKQCIQADDPEHHTLSLVKYLARHALARLPQPASEAGKLSTDTGEEA